MNATNSASFDVAAAAVADVKSRDYCERVWKLQPACLAG
jgi:hypothetical protein